MGPISCPFFRVLPFVTCEDHNLLLCRVLGCRQGFGLRVWAEELVEGRTEYRSLHTYNRVWGLLRVVYTLRNPKEQ